MTLNTLDKEVVFYNIDDPLFNRYQLLAKSNIPNLEQFVPEQYQSINYHITICNIWCSLLAERERLYLNEQKRMDYSVIFVQLEFVERNSILQNYIVNNELNEHELYILAFFVSMEMMLWIEQVMLTNNESQLVEYFMDEQSLRINNAPQKQTVFLKNITKNIKEKNDLYMAIQRAIRQTQKKIAK